MQYRVPKFIEQEARILGPLTIRQAMMMGFAFAICFISYFQIGEDNFFLFLLISTADFVILGSFAFLKIQGYDLSSFVSNFINYSISPRLYLWKRKKKDVFLCPKITRLPFKKEENIQDLTVRKSRLSSLDKKINFS